MEDEQPIFSALVKTGLILSILALAGGYLGRVHPLGDSLAIGRGYAAAAVGFFAVLAIRAGMQMAAFGSLLLAFITGMQVALVYFWQGPPGTFVVYQKNVFYRNADLAGLEADIRATDPLAVTLQEVSTANIAMLQSLKDAYPYQLHCTEGRRGGTAVLSKLPIVAGSETCSDDLAAFQVQWKNRQVWVVSVHLVWPWPHPQAAQVARLQRALQALDGPVVMAGDFNMVRWSWAVEALAISARSKAAGPARGTFLGFAPFLSLPIDQAFATNGGSVTYRPALGSDHLGLLAEMEP